jgi:hypothetical protein
VLFGAQNESQNLLGGEFPRAFLGQQKIANF